MLPLLAFLLVGAAVCTLEVNACTLEVNVEGAHRVTLEPSGRLSASNRTVFREREGGPLLLFHIIVAQKGGRWILGPEAERNDGLAFLDSSAFVPLDEEVAYVHPVPPTWMWVSNGTWRPVTRGPVVFGCAHSMVVPSVGLFAPLGNARWSHMGRSELSQDESGAWLLDGRAMQDEEPLEGSLPVWHSLRALSLPEQSSRELWNGLRIPMLGLGLGGLTREQTALVVPEAIRLGYRLLDGGRAYLNEDVAGEALQRSGNRSSVFVVSKVWPSHLGSYAPLVSVDEALRDWRTSWLDAMFLHWPACDDNVEWLRCPNPVEPGGTWKDSLLALAHAYADGRVLNIGVSNFDANLMLQACDVAPVPPHIIQNFADATHMPDDRLLMRRQDVGLECGHQVFQAYASQRNLRAQVEWHERAAEVGRKVGKTAHQVVTRLFLQHGIGQIPRTANMQHLRENLDMFSWSLTDEQAEYVVARPLAHIKDDL